MVVSFDFGADRIVLIAPENFVDIGSVDSRVVVGIVDAGVPVSLKNVSLKIDLFLRDLGSRGMGVPVVLLHLWEPVDRGVVPLMQIPRGVVVSLLRYSGLVDHGLILAHDLLRVGIHHSVDVHSRRQVARTVLVDVQCLSVNRKGLLGVLHLDYFFNFVNWMVVGNLRGGSVVIVDDFEPSLPHAVSLGNILHRLRCDVLRSVVSDHG